MTKITKILAYFVIISLSIIFTIGCGPTIRKKNDLMSLQIGRSYNSLDSAFRLTSVQAMSRNAESQFNLTYKNETYLVVATNIQTYIYKDWSRYEADPSSLDGTKRVDDTRTANDKFFLIFKDSNLINWGFLYQFKSSNDIATNEFGDVLENYFKSSKTK